MTTQIIAALIGSFGFAVFLKMKGKQIVLAGIGGGITWALYLCWKVYWAACSFRIF